MTNEEKIGALYETLRKMTMVAGMQYAHRPTIAIETPGDRPERLEAQAKELLVEADLNRRLRETCTEAWSLINKIDALRRDGQ